VFTGIALVAVVILMLVAAGAVGRRPHGLTGTWTLVFSDDFNGSSLGPNWEPDRYGRDHGGDPPFDRRGDDAWFSARNVSVHDGKLVITLRRQPKTFQGRTYPYSSGIVQTQQHYLVKPGSYIEARVKVPRCEGCWPAFWTVAPAVWPPEIDIFEFFGTSAQRRPAFNYHPPTGPPAGPLKYGDTTADYTNGYHVYGLLWDGYKAVPRLDGTPYRGATRNMTKIPQALILNMSVLAGRAPPPGSRMLVDWVRVWRPGASG